MKYKGHDRNNSKNEKIKYIENKDLLYVENEKYFTNNNKSTNIEIIHF